jgi:uncharacterized protein (UPF0335 family)
MSKHVLLVMIAIGVSGCVSGSEIRSINYRIDALERNQKSIHSDMKKLYNETESELSDQRTRLGNIEDSVGAIKRKTDQFEVHRDSNSLLFVPAGASE